MTLGGLKNMRVVVFTGGIVRLSTGTAKAIAAADTIIAADSGGRAALRAGVVPSLLIGDLDSLDNQSKMLLEQKGCQFITHQPEKDQTDTELAVHYAIENGASDITIIGGIEGDRLDHILANIFCVMDASIPITFVNGQTKAWLATGPTTVIIPGISNDLLSLIPLTNKVANVRTLQLKYVLDGETMLQNQARGISNVLTSSKAQVSFSKGKLLLVHTAAGQVDSHSNKALS